jgi:hypothetical protein
MALLRATTFCPRLSRLDEMTAPLSRLTQSRPTPTFIYSPSYSPSDIDVMIWMNNAGFPRRLFRTPSSPSPHSKHPFQPYRLCRHCWHGSCKTYPSNRERRMFPNTPERSQPSKASDTSPGPTLSGFLAVPSEQYGSDDVPQPVVYILPAPNPCAIHGGETISHVLRLLATDRTHRP